jgi:dihydrofolate reductase
MASSPDPTAKQTGSSLTRSSTSPNFGRSLTPSSWAVARLGKSSLQRMKVVVASRTLRSHDHPEVTILSEVNREVIQTLRAQSSKDIWLMGGGQLFNHLLHLHEVDTVEVNVIPVLLGAGVALLPPPAHQTKLKLTSHQVYPSGSVSLAYEVQH